MPLKGFEVADFVGDRVLGHRREGAEDADGAGGGSTFVRQHVIWRCTGKSPALQGTAANAPDGSRTRDLRLERPTLFGPP
jgi:hypothetical protein